MNQSTKDFADVLCLANRRQPCVHQIPLHPKYDLLHGLRIVTPSEDEREAGRASVLSNVCKGIQACRLGKVRTMLSNGSVNTYVFYVPQLNQDAFLCRYERSNLLMQDVAY